MANLDPQLERDAVDLITNCMYSVGFLHDIGDAIFSGNRDSLTVGKFYDGWFNATGRAQPVVPFNPGIVLAHMYVGILFAKENWFDLIPDVDLAATSASSWGLLGARVVAAREPRPNLRYVVRRIRNSLGHGSPAISVPSSGLSRQNMMSVVSVTFRDVNQRDPGDTFEAEAKLDQVFVLIKKFQEDVHQHVRTKYGVLSPQR